MNLRVIDLPAGGRLIVEAEETSGDLPQEILELLKSDEADTSRPSGADPVTKRDHLRKASSLLQDQLDGLASLAQSALASGKPSEVTLEAHVKFKGDVAFIPFIAEASGEGGLKLTLKWKEE